jgi:hypothetical protein
MLRSHIERSFSTNLGALTAAGKALNGGEQPPRDRKREQTGNEHPDRGRFWDGCIAHQSPHGASTQAPLAEPIIYHNAIGQESYTVKKYLRRWRSISVTNLVLQLNTEKTGETSFY